MAEREAPRQLWRPGADRVSGSQLRRYMDWLERERELQFATYDALWQWSVDDIAGFWATIWDYFEIKAHKPYIQVLGRRDMPGAEWFSGAELNYAEHLLRHETADRPAILYASETQSLQAMSWAALRAQAGSVAAWLKAQGVGRGDRVVAYAANTPETIVAFLATVSLGAIWSVCSPDMGLPSVLDRFRQIEPVVLFAVPGVHYNGKPIDKGAVVAELVQALPSLRSLALMPGDSAQAPPEGVAIGRWPEILARPAPLEIEPVPFAHPLWIVYSSGTTGLPKPIVHGHGGMLIEMLKMMSLQNDIGPDDVYHWYSSTGWIMWNIQTVGLAVGATIALYDGSPNWPDWTALWRFAGAAKLTVFGAGAAFYANCQKADVHPRAVADLSALRTVGSTGSPLSEESYDWIYRELGDDVWLVPISGGTDLAGAFVGGCVMLPVHAGEMQCRCLGADIHAYDEAGKTLTDEVGELVCASPLPSMPLYLWNDQGNKRYHDSYFDMYPGIWRHGDWIRITPRGGAVIYGRSDATINRHGLRLGTAEIYRAVEELPEVLDSLVVDLEYLGRDSYMPLFVVLRPGVTLDAALADRINQSIRKTVSARFVPNDIFQVADVPRTLSGKKLEVPVKKILLGQPAAKVANPGTMANPASLDWFVNFAASRLPAPPAPAAR